MLFYDLSTKFLLQIFVGYIFYYFRIKTDCYIRQNNSSETAGIHYISRCTFLFKTRRSVKMAAAVLAVDTSGYLRNSLGDKVSSTDIAALEEWLSARIETEYQAWKRQLTAAMKEIERERKAGLDLCNAIKSANDRLQQFFNANTWLTREPSIFHAADLDSKTSQVKLLERNLTALLQLARQFVADDQQESHGGFSQLPIIYEKIDRRGSLVISTDVSVQTEAMQRVDRTTQAQLNQKLINASSSSYRTTGAKLHKSTSCSDLSSAKSTNSSKSSRMSEQQHQQHMMIKGQSTQQKNFLMDDNRGQSYGTVRADEHYVRNQVVVVTAERIDKVQNSTNGLPFISLDVDNSVLRTQGFLTGRKILYNEMSTDRGDQRDMKTSRDNAKQVAVNTKLLSSAKHHSKVMSIIFQTAKCLHCHKLYKINENGDTSCRYHPMSKKRLDKFDINKNVINVEYLWECCLQTTDAIGCTIGKHV